jgi:hypothetical protein
MAATTKDRAAMVASQLVPIPLIETRPCWGRMGDGQCEACSLLTEPGSEHLVKFPRLDVLVPDLVVRRIEGQDRLICRNRRTSSPHRPAALGGADGVDVGALAHVVHAQTLRAPPVVHKPLPCGGAQ